MNKKRTFKIEYELFRLENCFNLKNHGNSRLERKLIFQDYEGNGKLIGTCGVRVRTN